MRTTVVFVGVGVALLVGGAVVPVWAHHAFAAEFDAASPIELSSFHFSESCTFDRNKNLILAMNTGNRGDATENDGFVSLINPDGTGRSSMALVTNSGITFSGNWRGP